MRCFKILGHISIAMGANLKTDIYYFQNFKFHFVQLIIHHVIFSFKFNEFLSGMLKFIAFLYEVVASAAWSCPYLIVWKYFLPPFLCHRLPFHQHWNQLM